MGRKRGRRREGDSQLLYSWQSLYGVPFPQPRGGPPASWAGSSVYPSMPATGPSHTSFPPTPAPPPTLSCTGGKRRLTPDSLRVGIFLAMLGHRRSLGEPAHLPRLC